MIFILGLPWSLCGQTSTTSASQSSLASHLEWFWGIDAGISFSEKNDYKQELQAFCAELRRQKADFKTPKKYLKMVFQKIHRKYLRYYENYSLLGETFAKGSYDCVSGTALYALVLQELGFAYQIKESPYHAYLVVNLDDAETILLESTNPIGGLIEGKELIAETEEKYRRQTPLKNDIPLSHFTRDITLKQLAGLHYYNEAVTYFNRQDYKVARKILQKALVLYAEDRIYTLLQVSESFLPTVMASK